MTNPRWTSNLRDTRPYGWAKPRLTGQQRIDIGGRLADGETAKSLALEYGVTAATIRSLR